MSPKPIFFASRSTSILPLFAASFLSILTMSANVSIKYAVISVIPEMVETSTSLLRSSQIAKIASSLNVFMYSSMSSFDISTNLFILKWSTPISSERTDFSRHSARFEPIPITSPVAFI